MWSFALGVGETSPWQSIRGLAALQMLRYGGIHGRRGGGDLGSGAEADSGCSQEGELGGEVYDCGLDS